MYDHWVHHDTFEWFEVRAETVYYFKKLSTDACDEVEAHRILAECRERYPNHDWELVLAYEQYIKGEMKLV